ncbi:MAG: YiiG family protein [Bacteroidetes bacterium]|nr:YiiG family protein [Bacteroidota bacterium]MCB0843201.1 YiiG family protein [Bacteroidota bacterium]
MAKIKSSPTRNLLFLALIIFSLIYYFQGKGLDINPFSSEEKKIEQEVEIKVEAKPIMEASQASTFEKLNIYVDVLNRQSRRIIDSYARYLSWCNKETGPTGQERHKYGLYSLYDHTKVGSDFEKAQAISPAMPDIEGKALLFLAALNAVHEKVGEAYDYYDQEDYKDDGLAKGKEMHVPLIASFEAFMAIDAEMRKAVGMQVEKVMAQTHLNAEQENDKILLWTIRSLNEAQKVVEMGNLEDIMTLNVEEYTHQLDTYNQVVDSMEYYLENWQDPDPGVSRIKSMIGGHKNLLKSGKELMRRVRDKDEFTQTEKRISGRNGGWMVSGSAAKLISDYNNILGNYNHIRYKTELPKLLEVSLSFPNGPTL